MRVKFTPSARTQFLEGLEYIRQDSPLAAQRFREKAEQVLRRLEKFPESGFLNFLDFLTAKSSFGRIDFFIGWLARQFGLWRFGMVHNCLKGRAIKNRLT